MPSGPSLSEDEQIKVPGGEHAACIRPSACIRRWAMCMHPMHQLTGPLFVAVQVLIAEASTLRSLVALLGSTHERSRLHTIKAIASLAHENGVNQTMLTQLLLEPLTTGAVAGAGAGAGAGGGTHVWSEEAQERVAAALWALVEANPDAHSTIAKAGDPAVLVELLKAGIPTAKEYALWSLSLSICDDNQMAVAAAGGVQPLIEQL